MKDLSKETSSKGFLNKVGIGLIVFLSGLWVKTLRFSLRDKEGFNSGTYANPALAVFWHNRVFTLPYLMHLKLRQRTAAMASRSKDGQLIADILERLEIGTIRGSADKRGKSKGGAAALIGMIRHLKSGKVGCIIPDGPRGPLYSVQPGAAAAAQKTGVAIVPLSVNCSSYWKVNSWDKLQIPKPFSRVELVVGDFLYIDKDVSSEEAQALVSQALMAITED